jgi:catechol 2,3-dioxygenase-like lactoylglutathione lyase family enzyme
MIEVHRRVDDGVTVVWMGEPERPEEFVIVIIGVDHAAAVEPAPMAHIGFAVASHAVVDEVARRAADEGLTVQGPVESGPVVGYYCIIPDPSGNKVEFSHGQSLGADVSETPR